MSSLDLQTHLAHCQPVMIFFATLKNRTPWVTLHICVQFPRILWDSTACRVPSNSPQLSPQNQPLFSAICGSWGCCLSSYLWESWVFQVGLFIFLYSSFKRHVAKTISVLTQQRGKLFPRTANKNLHLFSTSFNSYLIVKVLW